MDEVIADDLREEIQHEVLECLRFRSVIAERRNLESFEIFYHREDLVDGFVDHCDYFFGVDESLVAGRNHFGDERLVLRVCSLWFIFEAVEPMNVERSRTLGEQLRLAGLEVDFASDMGARRKASAESGPGSRVQDL